MGHFIGIGERQIYVHDDGKWYSNPNRTHELNPEDFSVVKENKPRPLIYKEDASTVHLGTEETNTLSCSECGFIAKSLAGLGAHKVSHRR